MGREITSAHVVLAALKNEMPPEVKTLEDAALGFATAHRRWFQSCLSQDEKAALFEESSKAFGELQQAALDFADFIDRTAPK